MEASKIAPHSVGLLAERRVFALQFFEGHYDFDFSKGKPGGARCGGEGLGETLHNAGLSAARGEDRASDYITHHYQPLSRRPTKRA